MRSFNPKKKLISQLFGPKVKCAVCQVCSLHPRPRIELRPSGTVAGLMPNWELQSRDENENENHQIVAAIIVPNMSPANDPNIKQHPAALI